MNGEYVHDKNTFPMKFVLFISDFFFTDLIKLLWRDEH